MTYALDTLYSWPFWIGAVCGLVTWKLYCRQKARWLDRHYPLPGGEKHYVSHINRLWIAGLAMGLSIGYILLTAQKTHDQTVGLAHSVAHCWTESFQSTKAQIDLNAQNDGISRQQQNLQREYDRATSEWLKALVNPPGDLVDEDTNSPARKAWGLEATANYQLKLNDLGTQFDNLVNQRKTLDAERAQHPLPESTCGK